MPVTLPLEGRLPEVGEPAPDFDLPDQHGVPVRLSGYRGRSAVLLVFFPHAFTPTCTRELSALRDSSEGSATGRGGAGPAGGAEVVTLGISCDPTAALRAFSDAEGIDYPLLSDFWPHGAVSRGYGVFFSPRGFATRGSFLVDRDGVLRWRVVNGPGDERAAADHAAALEALRAG